MFLSTFTFITTDFIINHGTHSPLIQTCYGILSRWFHYQWYLFAGVNHVLKQRDSHLESRIRTLDTEDRMVKIIRTFRFKRHRECVIYYQSH